MRHRLAGKELSRTSSHRRALRRNMAKSLFEYEAIKTTEVKAKELRPFVEKLITKAKLGTLHARRQVIAILQDREMVTEDGDLRDESCPTVIRKLFTQIAPRYANRPGGYTRIIRLSERRIGDAGKQVLLQLVEETTAKAEEGTAAPGSASRRRRRAAKRHEAATATAAAPAAKSEPQADQPAQDQPKAE